MGKVNKISIVGAGNVGASTLQRIVDRELAYEVVVTDIVEGLPQGKALDIRESMPISGVDVNVYGSSEGSMSAISGSDIVIVTAGLARKPGMTRLDLLKTNGGIIQGVARNIRKYAPNSIVIVVSNPLDVTSYIAYKVTGFGAKKVIGMAGVLDSARFRTFIADELKVSTKDVYTFVLGGHGDTMVPLISHTTVAGIPLTELMPKEQIDKLVERTRNGGGEIVNLIKSGSAYYAPSLAVVDMVDAIVNDKKRVLPCSAYLNGEYGVKDLFIGVPVKLGKNGIEEVVKIRLPQDEQAAFTRSIEAIKKEVAECPEDLLKP